MGLPHHCHQLGADTFQGRKNIQHFRRFTAVGVGNHHIIGGHHAQISVNAFRRMEEKSRCAGAGHGSRHLAGNVAGLAHTCQHHPPFGVFNQMNSLLKLAVQFIHQGNHRLRFIAEHS